MIYIDTYNSPIGELSLASDGTNLCGLWLANQKYFMYKLNISQALREEKTPALDETRKWLDIYFSGQEPSFMPKIALHGTPFQEQVWDILRQIPYGKTTSYGALAKQIAAKRGLNKMSARAVGTAVGHNPISIIVPCHRVIGTNGKLTGYAGGLERKEFLLNLEAKS